jgi:hypothetical protein
MRELLTSWPNILLASGRELLARGETGRGKLLVHLFRASNFLRDSRIALNLHRTASIDTKRERERERLESQRAAEVRTYFTRRITETHPPLCPR